MANYLDIVPLWVDLECCEATLNESFDNSGLLARVTYKSPLPLRKAAERLARYATREGGYDFPGYTAGERDQSAVVYLWGSEGFGKVPAVGFACFRLRDYSDTGPFQTLCWVWLHPYCRRQGLLKRAWPHFVREHGEFLVEPPLSRGMHGFLSEHTNYWAWLEKMLEPNRAHQ
jgi:hypothetical protein